VIHKKILRLIPTPSLVQAENESDSDIVNESEIDNESESGDRNYRLRKRKRLIPRNTKCSNFKRKRVRTESITRTSGSIVRKKKK
jgi:hypothetical protein